MAPSSTDVVNGCPPDEIIVDETMVLDKPRSPFLKDAQRQAKKGCRSDNNVLQQTNTSIDLGIGTATAAAHILKVSFRDMLVGENHIESEKKSLDDLDVVVTEGDVRLMNDGPIPEIMFSDQVHDAIDKKLANSVIIRLLGKSIGYRALLNRIHSLWNLSGEFCLIDLDNDYFLVLFAEEDDFTKVITGGPWVVYCAYLTVQPWSREFMTSSGYPSKIMAWVRLPNLPYRYYTKSLFRHIANAIGLVIRIDHNTTQGNRGRFARLAVIVDLTKPLISGIIIDKRRQDIEYEWLPNICYKCGKFGHTMDCCDWDNNTIDNFVKNTREQRNPDELYGPWMQAPSRRRRPITARQGGAMLREQDGPVGSILNQAAGGMVSGILNAIHGSALAPDGPSKQKEGEVLRQITTDSVNKGDTRGELSISDLPHVTSHDGNAKEHSVKVASKDRIVSGTTTLNKEFHTVVGSTISSSKGGAKGSLRVFTVQKVSSKGRKKDNKAVVPVTVSDRMSYFRTDLNRVAMDIGQEDDGATVLGDASEAVVQWSDNVTYDSQIRDDMLA
ncbi:hypothetical protein GQ457_08G018670 [Hibiscus cannabinus]